MTEQDDLRINGASANTATGHPGALGELPPIASGTLVGDAIALEHLAAALDLRFPHHNAPGDRLGRVLEEIGELNEAILTVDHQFAHVAKELHDVLRVVAGISHHYQLPIQLVEHDTHAASAGATTEVPVLLAQLTSAAGTLAKSVHHLEGTGRKRERYGPPVPARLAGAIDEVLSLLLAVASRYNLHDAVHVAIQNDRDRYRQAGYLIDDRHESGATDA